METTTNPEAKMTRKQEIQDEIAKMNSRAANIWSREESRKFSDDMRKLKTELKKLG